ncbi:FecCD family ABC transporter permease [Janibacter sp. G1551]|uniref:FecCD family ABC transporter permease n=1 Tax=Janibacter sp. G1551 TaxID=3420440 RepID=UPI003CFF5A79
MSVLASRPAMALATGVAALVAACVVSLGVGARRLSVSTVWAALVDPDPALFDHAVVQEHIPRTLVGLLVGAALALAGAALQGMTHNPLADPGILGLNAGATAAVVAAIHLLGIGDISGHVWFAFAGAALAALVVHLVASLGGGGATPLTLALAGAAVTAGLTSVTGLLLVLSSESLELYRFWQLGSLAGRDGELLRATAPFVVVGLLIVLGGARALDALALGDDVARGLGQRVGPTRVVLGMGVVLLCGASVALAGPIGFVGLVVPHVARRLAGPDHRAMLALCALLGPVLLLAADVLGRVVMPPGEVQAGVMTALVGAPVFIAVVRGSRVGA